MVYPIARHTFFSFINLWIRKVYGGKNLRKESRFIIASNHASFADDLILPTCLILSLNKYVHMYCNDAFYKNFFLRKFLEWGRCIPVRVDEKSEESKQVNAKAFSDALKFLGKGDIVGIFPEGHRSLDGVLLKAKNGIAKLALSARVPVIPIGMRGTHKILPKRSKFVKFKRCDVHIGEPLHLDGYYGQESNKNILNDVTSLIMKEVARLADLEYKY